MTDSHDKPQRPAPAAERVERERRLARALRDNLRRRKDQARAKAGDPAAKAAGQDGADDAKRSG